MADEYPLLITDGKRLQGSAMPRIVERFRAAVIGKRITNAGYVVFVPGDEPVPFLECEDGTFITARQDDEGNGPGVLLASTHTDDEGLCETELKP
jgi:hypothetical protein